MLASTCMRRAHSYLLGRVRSEQIALLLDGMHYAGHHTVDSISLQVMRSWFSKDSYDGPCKAEGNHLCVMLHVVVVTRLTIHNGMD